MPREMNGSSKAGGRLSLSNLSSDESIKSPSLLMALVTTILQCTLVESSEMSRRSDMYSRDDKNGKDERV